MIKISIIQRRVQYLQNMRKLQMIVKTNKGYVVKSEKGKTLSKPMSKPQAEKRLAQVEYFKNKKGSK